MTLLRPRTSILFLGDIFFFAFSLWLSLAVRTLEFPSRAVFVAHLLPFSLLFLVWVLIFFIAGLYESRSIILARRALSDTLLIAQSLNIGIAALFFFFVPIFGIAPKTLLVIYLVVSFLLVLSWRAFLFPLLGLQRTENALMVGAGQEVAELTDMLAHAHRAPARVAVTIDPGEASLLAAVQHAQRQYRPLFIIADFNDPRVSAAFPELYNYLLQGIRFLDVQALYEDVFGRVPLRTLNESWIARNASRAAHMLYDPLKRAIDIMCAVAIGVVSLPAYPFIIAAIWIEDRGTPFVSLPRVGEGGRVFNMYKFRSMTGYDPSGMLKLQITRVGKFLRRWRLDELPQLWNIIIGDMSLVGPRPETPALVATYEQEIPFYAVRHLMKPGLSGQAQLYYHGDPHGTTDISATKMKLSYDLFYLKHRSLMLDLSILIKTARRLVMRSNA